MSVPHLIWTRRSRALSEIPDSPCKEGPDHWAKTTVKQITVVIVNLGIPSAIILLIFTNITEADLFLARHMIRPLQLSPSFVLRITHNHDQANQPLHEHRTPDKATYARSPPPHPRNLGLPATAGAWNGRCIGAVGIIIIMHRRSGKKTKRGK